ncbi:MAG: aspartate--ammonia ligase [Tenuifilaceae bacterium]|nr:aspartate--ammonia ligase [Tenuifilaceae bacterium]
MQIAINKPSVKSLIRSGLETEMAIELAKTTFSSVLAQNLNLFKVSAPIAVEANTGVNDDLNGVERAVCFPIRDMQTTTGVVVQSLAKWKRLRLQQLELQAGQGIITDMKALRPDETLSPIHSIFVDQWDWEQVIGLEQRNLDYLISTVDLIYKAMLQAERQVCEAYSQLRPILPPRITPIHSQDLLDRYPLLTPKGREHKIAQELGAVFIIGIGDKLSNGEPHDGRAPDYDDWSTTTSNGLTGLNGDIIVWNPVLSSAFEISSMGIRVDRLSMLRQLALCGCEERAHLMYHQMLLAEKLPQTIGGGIGQSRLCMFLLRKKHIGEVQVGIWPQPMRLAYGAQGVNLI